MGFEKYILDENNNPVVEPNVVKWGQWMGTSLRRRVGSDEPIPGVKVSTVFLGLDHSWDDGPPVLWETMIFGGQFDEYQERYTSFNDAKEGHAKAVLMVLEGNNPKDVSFEQEILMQSADKNACGSRLRGLCADLISFQE